MRPASHAGNALVIALLASSLTLNACLAAVFMRDRGMAVKAAVAMSVEDPAPQAEIIPARVAPPKPPPVPAPAPIALAKPAPVTPAPVARPVEPAAVTPEPELRVERPIVDDRDLDEALRDLVSGSSPFARRDAIQRLGGVERVEGPLQSRKLEVFASLEIAARSDPERDVRDAALNTLAGTTSPEGFASLTRAGFTEGTVTQVSIRIANDIAGAAYADRLGNDPAAAREEHARRALGLARILEGVPDHTTWSGEWYQSGPATRSLLERAIRSTANVELRQQAEELLQQVADRC